MSLLGYDEIDTFPLFGAIAILNCKYTQDRHRAWYHPRLYMPRLLQLLRKVLESVIDESLSICVATERGNRGRGWKEPRFGDNGEELREQNSAGVSHRIVKLWICVMEEQRRPVYQRKQMWNVATLGTTEAVSREALFVI